MIRSLNAQQLLILRRCDGGLHVWETGPALEALLAELEVLRHWKLVSFDETSGYETTPAGDAWLDRLDG